MKSIIRLLILITIFPIVNLNSQSIITDRPDQTESATTVPIGSFQIETGFSLEYIKSDGMHYQNWYGPSNLFRIGLTDFIELRVVTNLVNLKYIGKGYSTTGISDLEVGGKVNIYTSTNGKFILGFLSHLIIPTGSYDLTNTKYGTINKFALSYSLSDKVGLACNLGYDYFGYENGNLVYTFVAGYSITDKLGLYAEVYGDVDNFKDNYSSFDGGFTYLIRNNLQYDFSFGTGINHRMNYVSTGISWNIGGYN